MTRTGDHRAIAYTALAYSQKPTQPPTLGWSENEYRSRCGDALRLAVQ